MDLRRLLRSQSFRYDWDSCDEFLRNTVAWHLVAGRMDDALVLFGLERISAERRTTRYLSSCRPGGLDLRPPRHHGGVRPGPAGFSWQAPPHAALPSSVAHSPD